MKFFKTRLDNKLTVIGELRPTAVSSALGFFVRTGARDESGDIAGVSHFLEHMMFKGTEKRSALDISYELAAIGAQANAYTSEENTVYYASVLPEYLPQALELFSDMLRPKLDEQEFDVEKKVILEEIALYNDRPSHVLFESALQTHFAGHTAGQAVLGTIASVSGISVEAMRNYFYSRYVPSNIVLAFSGNFSWEQVLELAGQYTAAWPDKKVTRAVKPHHPKKSEKTLSKENLHRAHLCILSNGPSAKDEERYAAEVLGCILGDSTGSRTFWEILDKGLADSVSIESDEMDGTGFVLAYASVSTERLAEVEEILKKILLSPANFSEADLVRAKTKLATRLVLQGESSMRRLMSIGLDWMYRGEYLKLEDELAHLKSVSRKSIEKMLERFSFEPQTVVRLLPKL